MKPSSLLFATVAAFSLAACTKPASTETTTVAVPEPTTAQSTVAPSDGTIAQPAASPQDTQQVADAQDSDDQDPDPTAEQGQPATPARPRFNDADANHDNRLTQAESAAMPFVAKHFAQIDTDHDGYVTRREFRVARDEMKAARASKANPG